MKYFKQELSTYISHSRIYKYWYFREIDNNWLATIRFDTERSLYESWANYAFPISNTNAQYTGSSFDDAHNFILTILNKNGYKPIQQHLEILI
jgi:hypothetical protein